MTKEFIKNKNMKYPDTDMYNYIIAQFAERGVYLSDIAEIARDSQKRFFPDLGEDECMEALTDILHKREVMNIIAVGLVIDRDATQGTLPQPMQVIVENDLPVEGADEWLAIGISLTKGSISTSNFGELDIEKHGIIKDIDEATDHVNTFLDDIIGALAACVEAKVAHARA